MANQEQQQLAFRLIASNITRLRIEKGLDIDGLAALSMVDRSHIYRIECGKRKIGIDVLLRIVSALEIDISEIFKIPDDMENIYSNLTDYVTLHNEDSLNSKKCLCMQRFVEFINECDSTDLDDLFAAMNRTTRRQIT